MIVGLSRVLHGVVSLALGVSALASCSSGYDCEDEDPSLVIQITWEGDGGDASSAINYLEFEVRWYDSQAGAHQSRTLSLEVEDALIEDNQTGLRVPLGDELRSPLPSIALAVRSFTNDPSSTPRPTPTATSHQQVTLKPNACNLAEVTLKKDTHLCEKACTLTPDNIVFSKVECSADSRCYVSAPTSAEVSCASGSECSVTCDSSSCPTLICLAGAACVRGCETLDDCPIDCRSGPSLACVPSSADKKSSRVCNTRCPEE